MTEVAVDSTAIAAEQQRFRYFAAIEAAQQSGHAMGTPEFAQAVREALRILEGQSE